MCVCECVCVCVCIYVYTYKHIIYVSYYKKSASDGSSLDDVRAATGGH